MLSKIIVATLLASGLLLSGCATPTKMALSNSSDVASNTGKPIYLMTATLRNSYHTTYQPKLFVVNVEKAGAQDKADRLNFTMDDKAKNESDSPATGNSYLLRMELDPGEYVIEGLTSRNFSFPIIATYFAPMHEPLKSVGQGIFYLGHVEATIRERTGDEFKAGPTVPLLDQAVAGASGGTFDVEISDQWDKDGPQFLAKFPSLSAVTVQKVILPPFDREKAQKWWETH